MRNRNAESPVHPAASYRREAREALKGKWGSALLIGLIIALLTGLIFGAEVNYTAGEGILSVDELTASIGPFASISYWKSGRMMMDAGNLQNEAVRGMIVVPYSAAFVWAALALSLLIIVLNPVVSIGQTRMGIALLNGRKPDLNVFSVGWKLYWKFVRMRLLIFVRCGWPMVASGVLAAFAASAWEGWSDGAIILTGLTVLLLLIAGIVLYVAKALEYVLAVYLAVTKPDLNARAVLRLSSICMWMRKGRLVRLELSFFGWAALMGVVSGGMMLALEGTPFAWVSSIAQGIMMIPLVIYRSTAVTAFAVDSVGGNRTGETEDAGAQAEKAGTAEPGAEMKDDKKTVYVRDDAGNDPWDSK